MGGRCLRVVLADDMTERVQGLRERSNLGPYDGMLFVYDEPVDGAFTMSTVPVPLEIGFYDGRRHAGVTAPHEAVPARRSRLPRLSLERAVHLRARDAHAERCPSGALSGCN